MRNANAAKPGRKKNDGRGKTGGRKKGTPNKDKPLKATLREHSLEYFSTKKPVLDNDGNPLNGPDGEQLMLTQYEQDMLCMKPADRVNAELALMKFHTPTMQSTAVDMSVQESANTLADRLTRLSDGEDIPSDPE